MILAKDVLAVAYDAAALATISPRPDNLTRLAENGRLLEAIEATLSSLDRLSLTSTIPANRRRAVADALGRTSNAADYLEGQGWEAVVPWVITLLHPIREIEVES